MIVEIRKNWKLLAYYYVRPNTRRNKEELKARRVRFVLVSLSRNKEELKDFSVMSNSFSISVEIRKNWKIGAYKHKGYGSSRNKEELKEKDLCFFDVTKKSK